MTWSLDLPSTISFPMPTWAGFVHDVASARDNIGAAVYNGYEAVTDPLRKAPSYIEDKTSAIIGAASGPIQQAAASIDSGLKWGAAIIVLGLALYLLAVVGPFVPKPRGA